MAIIAYAKTLEEMVSRLEPNWSSPISASQCGEVKALAAKAGYKIIIAKDPEFEKEFRVWRTA